MPSDGMTPEQRAAQAAHAQKIRTERTLMELTGLNRTQIRRLQAFAARVTTEKAQIPPPPIPEAPQIKRADMSIKGQGFTNNDQRAANVTSAQTLQGVIPDGIVLHNGFLRMADIFGTLKDPL